MALVDDGKAVVREWQDVKFYGDKDTKLYLEKDNFTANDIAFGNVLNLREVYDFSKININNIEIDNTNISDFNFCGFYKWKEVFNNGEFHPEVFKNIENEYKIGNYIIVNGPIARFEVISRSDTVYLNLLWNSDLPPSYWMGASNHYYFLMIGDYLEGRFRVLGGRDAIKISSTVLDSVKTIEYKDGGVWKEFVLDDNTEGGSGSEGGSADSGGEGGSTDSEDGTNTEGSGTGAESGTDEVQNNNIDQIKQLIFDKINNEKPLMKKCDESGGNWTTNNTEFKNDNCEFYIINDNNSEVEINLGMFSDDKDYLVVENNSDLEITIKLKNTNISKQLNNNCFVLIHWYLDEEELTGYYSISDVLPLQITS